MTIVVLLFRNTAAMSCICGALRFSATTAPLCFVCTFPFQALYFRVIALILGNACLSTQLIFAERTTADRYQINHKHHFPAFWLLILRNFLGRLTGATTWWCQYVIFPAYNISSRNIVELQVSCANSHHFEVAHNVYAPTFWYDLFFSVGAWCCAEAFKDKYQHQPMFHHWCLKTYMYNVVSCPYHVLSCRQSP